MVLWEGNGEGRDGDSEGGSPGRGLLQRESERRGREGLPAVRDCHALVVTAPSTHESPGHDSFNLRSTRGFKIKLGNHEKGNHEKVVEIQ